MNLYIHLTHPFIFLPSHPTICLHPTHPYILSSFPPFYIHTSVYPFIHLSSHPSMHALTHTPACPSIFPSFLDLPLYLPSSLQPSTFEFIYFGKHLLSVSLMSDSVVKRKTPLTGKKLHRIVDIFTRLAENAKVCTPDLRDTDTLVCGDGLFVRK